MILLFFLCGGVMHAQENHPEPENEIEEQVETLAQGTEHDMEDDFHAQLIQHYIRHPLNLNEATPDEMREFKIFSEPQLQDFFSYRSLFGPLVSIYELQAIPSWNIFQIRRLLPFVVISDTKTILQSFRQRLRAGENNLLVRYSIVLPKSKGYLNRGTGSTGYTGSRSHVLLRYRYNYKNLLQYGFLGDKDAGEQFLKGAQKTGFDFYSFHVFARKVGIMKSIAIGDFTVNLGQGLTHWQGLAFKKGTSMIFAKRQADVLRPYTSAGEYNFHRGIGLSLAKKNLEMTTFASIRKFDATIKRDSGQAGEEYVSSLLKSGYHRSVSELKNRNNFGTVAVGSNIRYGFPKGHLAVNFIQYFFQKPFGKSDQPYDLFSIEGSRWANLSFDYSYTLRNIHFFGEFATDKTLGIAAISGLIGALDRSVDVSLVFRKIQKQYQSLWGNAFTASAMPSNENGIYTGISVRRGSILRIDAYADVYKVPWLSYTADAPSYGAEYLLQVSFTPNKQASLIVRYKRGKEQVNNNNALPTSYIHEPQRRSVRYHLSYNVNRELSFNNRIEVLWYGEKTSSKLSGFLTYADVRYKPAAKPYAANMRLQYFETDGYAARVYAYENDLLYAYSVPAFFEKGFRWYINLRTHVSKWIGSKARVNTELWVKFALTHYFELDKIGSELNEIHGRNRSEIKFQLLFAR